jgi:hypothetical protein
MWGAPLTSTLSASAIGGGLSQCANGSRCRPTFSSQKAAIREASSARKRFVKLGRLFRATTCLAAWRSQSAAVTIGMVVLSNGRPGVTAARRTRSRDDPCCGSSADAEEINAARARHASGFQSGRRAFSANQRLHWATSNLGTKLNLRPTRSNQPLCSSNHRSEGYPTARRGGSVSKIAEFLRKIYFDRKLEPLNLKTPPPSIAPEVNKGIYVRQSSKAPAEV